MSSSSSSSESMMVCMVLSASCLALLSSGGVATCTVVVALTLLQILVILYHDALVLIVAAATSQTTTMIQPATTTTSEETMSLLSEQQQQQRCNKIVEELYPETVRDRLLLLNQPQPQQQDTTAPPSSILDVYTESTVLFADIVGFTQWCANHTDNPLNVCTLLETLYSAFDQLLLQHKNILKVETIGDAYLAIAGISSSPSSPDPDPDPNHAQQMIQFAIDMLATSQRVLQSPQLIHSLDTASLQLRIGLHSGPVVAGVLRCGTIKSRFQIFGDTVNTASRMESTSQPNCIQISQTVYDSMMMMKAQQHVVSSNNKKDQLSTASFHVERRLDTVHAKGKGLMTTYWVTPPRCGDDIDDDKDTTATATTTSSSSSSNPDCQLVPTLEVPRVECVVMSKTASNMCSSSGWIDDSDDDDDDIYPQIVLQRKESSSLSSIPCPLSMSSRQLSASFMMLSSQRSIDDCFFTN